MRPTEAGLLFVQLARRILAERHRLDEELDRLSSPGGGIVVLGALPVAAAGVLPGVLTRLKAAHPGIRVRLHQGRTEELLPSLASGEIDLIVGAAVRARRPRRLQAGGALDRADFHSRPRRASDLLVGGGHCRGAAPLRPLLPTITQRVGQEIEHLTSALASSRPLRSAPVPTA